MGRLVVLFVLSMIVLSCNNTLTEKELEAYRAKGLLISKSTGKELSTTLTNKMKSGGLVEAVEFCNVAALPITQKMSDTHGVSIKRTSLKIRNPLNKPSENEILILKEFQSKLDSGVLVEPVVKLNENDIPNYYAPIFVEMKCLVCHGTLNQELSQAADSIIKINYPNDLATSFKEGDLRGIWSISFSKSKS